MFRVETVFQVSEFIAPLFIRNKESIKKALFVIAKKQ